MNKYALLFLVLLLCISGTNLNAQNKFAAGFVLGEPTGISWKYNMDQKNSLDGAIGFAPVSRFRAHVDYLWHSEPFNEKRLSLYYGPGVAFGIGHTDYIVVNGRNAYLFPDRDIGFGVRGVIGIEYLIPKSPVNIFLETAPILIMAPSSGFAMDLGLGARFYF